MSQPAWAMAAAPPPMDWATAPEDENDVLPIGAIYQSALDVDPGLPKPDGFGYGTWERWGHGRVVIGVDEEAPGFEEAETEGGSASVTPGGSVSQPTFTGAPLGTHSHGAGTLFPSAHSGAAVGDHASHTHTYTQVPNHVHVENVQGGTTASTTGTHIMTSAAAGGSLRQAATSTQNPTGGAATGTTNGPGATMTHSVTQPSDHTMSGSSQAVTAGTPAGTVSQPTFTGTPQIVRMPFITAYLWKRVA